MNKAKKSLIAPSLAILLVGNIYASQSYTIDTSSPNEAIKALSEAAQMPYMVDASILQNITTNPVKNATSTESALEQMFEGTGLEGVVKDETIVIIKKPSKMSLQMIEVTGRAEETSFASSSFAATKAETHILDLPQSVSAITKEIIKDQNLMRLNEIAPFVAGVNEFSVYNDITIRGFRTYDDRRVNGMRAYNNFWSQPTIAHLERVEVIKGPAAHTFGDASPGGVINMVTKKPLAESRNEMQAIVGNFDKKFIAVDTTGPLNESKTLLYRLNAALEDSGSFANQKFYKTNTIAPSISWVPSDDTRVNFDFVYVDTKSILDRGQPNLQGAQKLGQVPIEVRVTQPGDKLDTTELSATFTVEQKISDSWRGVASVMYTKYDEELIEHRIRNHVTPSTINMQYIDRDSEATVKNASTYLVGNIETGAFAHRIVAGVDLMSKDIVQKDISARDIGVFDLLNPTYFSRDIASYGATEASWSPWGTTLETTGVYLQDQIQFDSWEIMAGLRYDSFKTTGFEVDAKSPTQSDSHISPRLGVVYKLSEQQSIYGTWMTGFLPPEGWLNMEMYGGPFKPSTSELFELGYKQMFFNEQLLFTTAIYQLSHNDVVVWANDDENPDLYVQRGQEQSKGIEFELNGKVTEDLQIAANYAYSKAEITKDTDPTNVGKPKENAPEHTANLWGKYNLTNSWGVSAGATYVDKRHTWVESLQLPSYTIYNAGVHYTHKDFDANLLVKNLTDEVHWTGGYNYGRVFPGTPMDVSLNLRYRF